jgi:hypothetical protein
VQSAGTERKHARTQDFEVGLEQAHQYLSVKPASKANGCGFREQRYGQQNTRYRFVIHPVVNGICRKAAIQPISMVFIHSHKTNHSTLDQMVMPQNLNRWA